MTTRTTIIDPVGINEIADRLGVEPATVRSWQARAKHMTRQPPMPPPTLHLTNTPIWNWARIRDWAKETGRL
jgi:hypothetical protein